MTVAKSSNLLRPLGEFRTLLHLAPPAVSPGSTLVDILDVLAADQRPGVIMVIGEGANSSAGSRKPASRWTSC
jgi:hypothetical protein